MFAGLARAASVVLVAAAVSQISEKACAAGAAYVVDTAEVGEPGACKVESWMSAASNHDIFAATAPACVANIFRPVELSAQFVRTRADGEWATGVAPKVKINLIPGAIGSWSIGLSGVTAYDLTKQQNVATFVTVPATLPLSIRGADKSQRRLGMG